MFLFLRVIYYQIAEISMRTPTKRSRKAKHFLILETGNVCVRWAPKGAIRLLKTTMEKRAGK